MKVRGAPVANLQTVEKLRTPESPEVIFRPCGGAEQIPAFATRRSEFLQGVEIGIIWTFELIAVTGGFRLSNVWPLHEQMYERDGLLFSPSPGIQMYRKGQTWTMKTSDICKSMFRKSLSPRRAEKKEVIAWTTVQSPQKAIS